jgi:hypothetical protein
MSEVIIFAVGAVLFVVTTGATFSFGLVRVHEWQMDDMERSDRIAEVEELGLTEIHRARPLDERDVVAERL